MSDFKIKRSITEEDIPSPQKHRKSKYEGIYKSCKTLSPGEGIEVEVEKSHVRSILVKGLKKRFPRRTFTISERAQPKGYRLYILREKNRVL